jgi:phospholipid-binding lipoprotein MlaA
MTPYRHSPPGARSIQLALLMAGFALAGCASTSQPQQVDRFENVNRPVFHVNESFDDYTLGPVARGWIRITPAPVRDSISNAYRNLTFPDRFVACLGEGELRGAGEELARFLLDSTLGIAGLLDPAAELRLHKYDEDMGRMLAKWGVPAGAYLVIPFVGPSNARDLVGGVADLLLNPLTWTGFPGMGAGALFAINGRAQDEWAIQTAKKQSLDYYVSVRDAYIQRRSEPQTSPDALYDLLHEDRPGPLRADTPAQSN